MELLRSLAEILFWIIAVSIVWPSTVWITFRLIFEAYFKTKKNHKKGETQDGEK